ncbi:cell wall hydrolase [Phreatobacter stygius]|uniref:Cell wall hydrolase n=2 Tax=Phreatobacter stygius TaxID=1940610 RepID=A0A4D7BDZ7_9HYPH|nr:cell wall hydrolase [Phreatobacter stygius]
MTMASFAFARPMPREEAQPNRVLAHFDAAGAGRANPRSGDRLVGPAVGAGTGRAVVYPAVNREAKSDLLVERARLRPSLTAAQPTTALLQAPADLTTIARFSHDPAVERTDTEHSPLALGGVQLASIAPEAVLDDRSAAARLGLAGPAIGPADPVVAEDRPSNGQSHNGQSTDSQSTDGRSGDERRFATELTEERAGIAISGDGPLARAGAGFGAPALPLENEPFRVATTHEPVAGFDPILGAFATDRRGDRPDPALARAFRTPGPLRLEEPSPARLTRTGHPVLALALSGPALARAEKCLSEAVYWEARSEPERGQMAVAQVVVNRAVSGFYPRDICGVVYQNAHRYLACQFTFACEGRRSLAPTEVEPWTQASRIARDMLAGRTWIAEVGHATHYHATYVRPWWARSMNRLQQIGVHVFYRPRQWDPLPQVQLTQQPPHQS